MRREEPELSQRSSPLAWPTLRSVSCGAAVLLFWGVACGDSVRRFESDVDYETPLARVIVVETVVDLPFETAWDELIRRLSESAYRVEFLEKASRFVRVDLVRSSEGASAVNQPARYVDCGRTARALRDMSLGAREERFEYAVADSSRHRESREVEGGFRVSEVFRRVVLDASATILLQPEGSRRTRVTVKTRYRVEFEVSGTAVFQPLDASQEPRPLPSFGPRLESIHFTTFEPGRDRREGGLVCRATGDFEHELIALANPAAAI